MDVYVSIHVCVSYSCLRMYWLTFFDIIIIIIIF